MSVLVSDLSKFVFSGVNTGGGGGENSYLSSLRNAWGECIGVDGGVFSPSSKNSSCLSGDGSIGIKGSLSLRNTVLLLSLSNSILFYKLSLLLSILPLGFLIKRIPDEPPCYKPQARFSLSQGKIVAIL